MIPKRISGTTIVLGKPINWDESNGHCGGLAVRVSEFGRTIMCESAWEPTPEELRLLNEGGSVVLSMVGQQAPVHLRVERVQK